MRVRGLFFDKRSEMFDCASRWLLALVFLFAGVPKLLAVKDFAGVIGAYDLLPYALLLPTALFLSVAEIVAALGLLLRRRWGLFLTTFLLLVFIAVLGYGIAMGLDIDCGCFGPEDPEHAAFHGLRTALARDLLLFLPLSYLFYRSYSNQR